MEIEETAAGPLAGGILQHGYQCGMLWGSVLAAGAEAYRRYGPGAQAEAMAIVAALKLVESFRSLNSNINCLEITELDKSSTAWQMTKFFLVKGGVIGCFSMASKYAPVAFSEINDAFSDKPVEAPSPPVSCAALLARKTGASDMHAIMAAGFAGGIGLCGGACGALGTAIWLHGMKLIEQGGKVSWDSPKSAAIIDRFTKCTDFEFECSDIVGRKFDSIEDHAAYMRDGGCSKIIEALATN